MARTVLDGVESGIRAINWTKLRMREARVTNLGAMHRQFPQQLPTSERVVPG